VSNGVVPLLRRPFSIHKADGKQGRIEILYEVVGEGSAALSQRKAGEVLDIIGPLGRGFALNTPSENSGKDIVLVAGGMGVAPLFFLAQKLQESLAKKKNRSRICVLIGAKTSNHILCASELRRLGGHVSIATDDGSLGFRGKVTALLRRILDTRGCGVSNIYACGPHPMLSALSKLAHIYAIPAQVSLEAHMACGFGACLGCAVATIDGYKRVCKEGPVFNAEEIVWGAAHTEKQ
jgi:dihydroorotate dehydrogenase electron transfer subunit